MSEIYLIKDNKIINCIVSTITKAQQYYPDYICLERSESFNPNIGWELVNEVWQDTNIASINYITSVSMKQARLALLTNNILDIVNNIISLQPIEVQIQWEYSTEIFRDNPLVNLILSSPPINYTNAQIDELFSLAKTFV